MRTMGLDVGERTIGVAVSDALGWTAQRAGSDSPWQLGRRSETAAGNK